MAEWQPQKRFEQSLDYPQIIFLQVNAIREAKTEPAMFIKQVENLDDLLYPYWVEDKSYLDKTKELEKNSREKTAGLDPMLPKDKMIIAGIQERWARDVFKQQLLLIHRSGFLPFKEVEGVISDFDIKNVLALEAEIREREIAEELSKKEDKINKFDEENGRTKTTVQISV